MNCMQQSAAGRLLHCHGSNVRCLPSHLFLYFNQLLQCHMLFARFLTAEPSALVARSVSLTARKVALRKVHKLICMCCYDRVKSKSSIKVLS